MWCRIPSRAMSSVGGEISFLSVQSRSCWFISCFLVDDFNMFQHVSTPIKNEVRSSSVKEIRQNTGLSWNHRNHQAVQFSLVLPPDWFMMSAISAIPHHSSMSSIQATGAIPILRHLMDMPHDPLLVLVHGGRPGFHGKKNKNNLVHCVFLRTDSDPYLWSFFDHALAVCESSKTPVKSMVEMVKSLEKITMIWSPIKLWFGRIVPIKERWLGDGAHGSLNYPSHGYSFHGIWSTKPFSNAIEAILR